MSQSAEYAKLTKWHMDETAWYEMVVAHWTSSAIEAHDNEGVLGGWGEVDVEDAKGSLAFVQQCLGLPRLDEPMAGYRALDCGAGVGRVTGNVLLNVAERVHLVEVSERLLTQAQEKLAAHQPRLEFEASSLREFTPPPDSYNLVWAQWVLGHLTDSDVVGLLARCRAGLRQGGALVVKDNTASAADCDQCGGHYLLDEENAAVIRSHAHLKSLFKLAGLKLAQNATQTGFPEDLHPVRMYWLLPLDTASA